MTAEGCSSRMIARGITVEMFVGIHDIERERAQPVVANVVLEATVPHRPPRIEDCIDYRRVSTFIQSWKDRPHTELLETLLHDLVEFCFEDARIRAVDVEILKLAALPGVAAVGVGMRTDRASYAARSAAARAL